jgi:dUTPase
MSSNTELELVYHLLDPDAVKLDHEKLSDTIFYLCSREHVVIRPNERRKIPTGISLIIPEHYEGQIRTYHKAAMELGLLVVNSPGTIPSYCRQEIAVYAHNISDRVLEIFPKQKIALLAICFVPSIKLIPLISFT